MSEQRISGMAEKAIDVIVVEDDDDLRTMLGTVLTAEGWLVRTFARGDAAYESALARVPDAVVTDLRIDGERGGSELARALRAELTTKRVALVAVSGQADVPAHVIAAFDAFFAKPVEIAPLVEQLSALARGARTARVADCEDARRDRKTTRM